MYIRLFQWAHANENVVKNCNHALDLFDYIRERFKHVDPAVRKYIQSLIRNAAH